MAVTEGIIPNNGVWGYTPQTPETFDQSTLTPNLGSVVPSGTYALRPWLDVRSYGAKGDGRTGTDGAISSGLNVFTSATAAFAEEADVGKLFVVRGAGALGVDLATTIAAVIDNHTVQLAANAGTTVSGAGFAYGTDDLAARHAAVTAAIALGGGVVFFPQGYYCMSDNDTAFDRVNGCSPNNCAFLGTGPMSIIHEMGGNLAVLDFNDTTNFYISGLKLVGTVTGTVQGRGALRFQKFASFGGRKITIGDLWIDYVGTSGLVLDNCSGATVGRVIINNTAEHGIYLATNTTEVAIGIAVLTNIGKALGNRLPVSQQGVRWTATDSVISSLIIDTAVDGVLFENGAARNNVAGGVIRSCTARGVRANSGAASNSVMGVTFFGNVAAGVRDLGSSGLKVSGCTFDQAAGPPVVLSSGSSDAMIAANTLVASPASVNAVDVTGTNHTIQNNHVESGCNGGVTVRSTSTGTVVRNNDLRNGAGNAFADAGSGTTVRHNSGYNPIGVEVVAVPATTVAVVASNHDRTYYITAGATSITVAIESGPTITIPAAALAAVRVPAGKTLTPTYTNAPTWVVEGE